MLDSGLLEGAMEEADRAGRGHKRTLDTLLELPAFSFKIVPAVFSLFSGLSLPN